MLKELKIKSVGHRLTILKQLQKLKFLFGFADPLESQSQTHSQANLDIGASYSSLNNNSNNSNSGNNNNNGNNDNLLRFEDMIRERDMIIDEIFKQLSQLRSEVESIKHSISHSPASTGANSTSVTSATDKNSSRLRSQTLPSKSSQKSGGTPEEKSPSLPSASEEGSQHLVRRPSKNVNNVSPQTSPYANQESGAIRVYGHKLLNHDYESYKSILVSINDTCSKVLPLSMKKWKINDDWKKYALFMAFKGQEICLSYDDRPLALLLQYKSATETPVFVLKSLRTTESMYMKNEIRVSASDPSSVVHSQADLSARNHSNSPAIPSSAFQTGEETAVAIYEYKAERDDELDVNIGDTFLVKDKSGAAGWWIVENNGKTGWVPAGCLLENTAIEAKGETTLSQGIALYDYDAIGVNELSIKKGDMLQVQKKYQHWLLAELNGSQGWVPSCYVSLDESTTVQKFSSLHDSPPETGGSIEDRKLPRSNTTNFTQYKSSTTTSRDVLRDGSVSDLAKETDPSLAFNEFSHTLEKLKDVSKETKESPMTPNFASKATALTKTTLSPGSPAISKLDSLLDSFNPYLQDAGEEELPTYTAGKSSNKLAALLTDLGANLAELQESGSAQGSQNSLSSSDALVLTKDLADIVVNVNPGSKKYNLILEKLENILQESSVIAKSTSKQDLASSNDSLPGVTPEVINVTLSKAYMGLNDVAQLLLKESQSEDLPEGTSKRLSRFIQRSPSRDLASSLAAIDNSRTRPNETVSDVRKPGGARQSIIVGEGAKRNLSLDLAQRDNQAISAPGRQDSPNQSPRAGTKTKDDPPINAVKHYPMRIIPYDDLVKRKEDDLDLSNLEQYLSNEDCLTYL